MGQPLPLDGATLLEQLRSWGRALGFSQIGVAGIGGRGTLTGSTLEGSNVDLGQEFTNMIIAQRGFEANAKVITTSDQLLQDLVNLKQ